MGYELNYTLIELAHLVVVFSTQKLHHYMLNHKTNILVKIDPLKYLLSRVSLTRCIAKWIMLLSEFDIEYVDWKEIKGKVIWINWSMPPSKEIIPSLHNFQMIPS